MGEIEGKQPHEFRQGGAPQSDRGSSTPTAEDRRSSFYDPMSDQALWTAYYRLLDGDVAGADQSCDVAFQLKDQRCPAALTCRGLTRRALGQHHEAEEDFRLAKDLSPDNVSTVAAHVREATEQIIREQELAFRFLDWTSIARSDQAMEDDRQELRERSKRSSYADLIRLYKDAKSVDRRPPSRHSRMLQQFILAGTQSAGQEAGPSEHAPSLSQSFGTRAEFESPPIFLTAPKIKGSLAQIVQADLHFKGSLTGASHDQAALTLTLDAASFAVNQCWVTKDAVGYFPVEIEIIVTPGGWGSAGSLHKVRPGDELYAQLGERTGTTGWSAGLNFNVPTLLAGARFSRTRSTSTMHPIIGHHFLPASMVPATKAVQFVWKMDTWANGVPYDPSSAFRTMPMPPFGKPGHMNFPDLGENFEGVWMVPKSTAEVLHNKFDFNITLRVHLAAALRTTLALGLGTRYQVFRPSPFIELFNVISVQA